MKISARNIIKGTIVEVTKGQTTARVRIEANGTIITASIRGRWRARRSN